MIFFTTSHRYDFHYGVDIPAPRYTPVYAIADGTVLMNGSSPTNSIVQVFYVPLHVTYKVFKN